MRLGDCCKLRWADVLLDRGVIQVIPSKTRKHAHGKPVTIPIHPVLREALQNAIGHTANAISPDLSRIERRDTGYAQTASGECSPQKADTLGTIDSPHRLGTKDISTSNLIDANGRAVRCGNQSFQIASVEDRLRSPYVLPSIAALYTSARWRVSEQIARIFRAANIEMQIRVEGRKRLATEASFHSLRHTFVSLAANAGVPLAVVQSIVGHTSTVMTRHYYHENVDALIRAVNAIPAV